MCRVGKFTVASTCCCPGNKSLSRGQLYVDTLKRRQTVALPGPGWKEKESCENVHRMLVRMRIPCAETYQLVREQLHRHEEHDDTPVVSVS